jgi:hypothetical protein
MEFLSEWSCRKCLKKIRAFFKREAVLGPFLLGENEVLCPGCHEPQSLIPKPYRLDSEDGDVWISATAAV